MNTLENTKLNEFQKTRYNLLVSRMGLCGKSFSKAVEEVLIFMACYWFNRGGREIIECPVSDMYSILSAYKRIEGCDVPWLSAWMVDYENEQDESVKAEKLNWGVYFLINEDFRCQLWKPHNGDGKITNARCTFSEIHKDYSEVLGVSEDAIASAINNLVEGKLVYKAEESVWQFANPNFEELDYGDLVDGVVYVTSSFTSLICPRAWIRK